MAAHTHHAIYVGLCGSAVGLVIILLEDVIQVASAALGGFGTLHATREYESSRGLNWTRFISHFLLICYTKH